MTMIKLDVNKLLYPDAEKLKLEQKVGVLPGKNDCTLTDFEAMQVKMKFMPDIEMYDMTERLNEIVHLHKEFLCKRYNAQ